MSATTDSSSRWSSMPTLLGISTLQSQYQRKLAFAIFLFSWLRQPSAVGPARPPLSVHRLRHVVLSLPPQCRSQPSANKLAPAAHPSRPSQQDHPPHRPLSRTATRFCVTSSLAPSHSFPREEVPSPVFPSRPPHGAYFAGAMQARGC